MAATEVKISALGSATTLTGAELVPLVQSSTTVRSTVADLVTGMKTLGLGRWTSVTDFTAAPSTDSYASSSFSSTSAWATGTAYVAGNWVKPTAANGYLYECVTAGTSHGTTEPTWGTTYGADTNDNGVKWRCRGACVIATTSDLSATIPAGTPIRFTQTSVYYGIVVGASSSRLAIAGAPMLTNANVTALQYGSPELVKVVTFAKTGDYDAGVADVTPFPQFRWQYGPARLVTFEAIHGTNATGAGTNPYVNVKVGASVVSSNGDGSAADKGVQTSTSWVPNPWSAIKTAAYSVSRGTALVPTVTVTGSAADADNLTVLATFVLE